MMIFCIESFFGSIQESAIGRHSKAARIFLMRFKEKEISLTREWFMKEATDL
jgi:hypothetical protein